MGDLIKETLLQWTEDLNPTDARISIFEHIRDIPWYVAPYLRDPTSGPVQMLEEKRGSCIPKHYLLGKMFEFLNVSVKYVSYPFSWKDVQIPYPEKILELSKLIPVQYHLACKANLSGRWVLLDATWDPPLRAIGLPINLRWNGLSDTEPALPALDEIEHADASERHEYVERMKSKWSTQDGELSEEFYRSMSGWFEEIRRS